MPKRLKLTRYSEEYKTLSKKLKAERIKSNLEQSDIAKLLNKTQSDISKIESGKLRINVFELKKISKLLKKNLEYFLD